MKLTRENIGRLKLPSGKTDFIHWDDALPRFGLRLRPTGRHCWVVQYRTDSGQRRETIGTVAVLEADAARRKAKQILAKVQLGHDPAAEKRARQAQAAETFGAFVDRYLARQKARLRWRSYLEVERHLTVQAKPLHDLPLVRIERRTIAARIGTIAETSGPVAADRCRTSLSGFFSWAIREGLVETNPVSNTNRHSEDKPRDRVLSDNELRAVWAALPTDHEGGPDYYAAIVKLLLLTGQRRQEIAALRWSEIDFERAVISLPGERTKNHRDHEIPLSATALKILSAIPRHEGREFVFGWGVAGFSGWSHCKARLDEKAKIEPWTLHDLRRTMVTKMGEDLGILPHVVEAITNHISGFKAGVAGVYNKAVYAAEKRQALDRWADHLTAIVEGRASNVVSLRTASTDR
jgi:integrase